MLDSVEYVWYHDFEYKGENPTNKLLLRDKEDLVEYLRMALLSVHIMYEDGIATLMEDKSQAEIIIEEI